MAPDAPALAVETNGKFEHVKLGAVPLAAEKSHQDTVVLGHPNGPRGDQARIRLGLRHGVVGHPGVLGGSKSLSSRALDFRKGRNILGLGQTDDDPSWERVEFLLLHLALRLSGSCFGNDLFESVCAQAAFYPERADDECRRTEETE